MTECPPKFCQYRFRLQLHQRKHYEFIYRFFVKENFSSADCKGVKIWKQYIKKYKPKTDNFQNLEVTLFNLLKYWIIISFHTYRKLSSILCWKYFRTQFWIDEVRNAKFEVYIFLDLTNGLKDKHSGHLLDFSQKTFLQYIFPVELIKQWQYKQSSLTQLDIISILYLKLKNALICGLTGF